MAAKKKQAPFKKPGWKALPEGAVIPQSISRTRNTGSWSSVKPVWDKKKCVNCMLCALYCPESCIPEKDGKRLETDLTHCKGCGICALECPVKAIKMEHK
ncbi:MAG: 4Fe-4S binding protein [Candidatus Aenigmarchaeota archaeon]|nr:4Fe-4S binding protein [Candidatus Aenigmarchaeota archaeon]